MPKSAGRTFSVEFRVGRQLANVSASSGIADDARAAPDRRGNHFEPQPWRGLAAPPAASWSRPVSPLAAGSSSGSRRCARRPQQVQVTAWRPDPGVPVSQSDFPLRSPPRRRDQHHESVRRYEPHNLEHTCHRGSRSSVVTIRSRSPALGGSPIPATMESSRKPPWWPAGRSPISAPIIEAGSQGSGAPLTHTGTPTPSPTSPAAWLRRPTRPCKSTMRAS